MNKNELKSVMDKHGDIQSDLADYLGISRPTMCDKINGKASFTQPEIAMIIRKYDLDAEQMKLIFFSDAVS